MPLTELPYEDDPLAQESGVVHRQVQEDRGEEDDDHHAARPDDEPRASEAQEDDDDEQYGRRVQKRIDKEIWKRKKLRERVDALEGEIAARDRELEEMRKGRAKDSPPDEDIDQLEAEMKEAIEDDDLKRYHAANIRYQKAVLKKPSNGADPEERTEAPIASAARDWMDENADWFQSGSKGFDEARRKRALQINEELKREGMDFATDEFYEELDKRIGNGARPQRGDLPPTPDAAPSRRPGKVGRLTEEGKKTMRRYGLNPDNPKHREAYLKRDTALGPEPGEL